jgi:glycosyltransferase involved in cell wall biosynthesis
MSRLLERIRPDVLHLHSFKELTFSVLSAARKRRIPVLFSLYDLWALCPQSNLVHYRGGTCHAHMGFRCLACAVPARKPLILFRRAFFRHFLPLIDRFLVLSETVRRQLTQFGLPEKKIAILPLPLFEGLGRPAPGNLQDRSILFAGWMIRPKGLQILIEAMPLVLKRVPDAKVLVVETGAHAEHKADFQRRIAELGLWDKFRFLGKRSGPEIQALLARASVVAVPEQWGIAWPIFCTEAMSYAKPIAASRIGDIPYFIRDHETGRLFDPQSPEQLADCLIGFFADPAAARQMGRRAQDFILKECDPARIATTLLSHYQEVLG